jgi:molybdate transport system substrate-binding protein
MRAGNGEAAETMTITRRAFYWTCACALVALGVSSRVPAAAPSAQRPPTIAAAANLNFALTEIAERFAREKRTRIVVVFGASGTLARQIGDGAPFELFLAADEEFPNQLTSAGLTRDRGVVYAVGRLAIFAPTGSPLTVDERLDGLSRLMKSGRVERFAIANPDVAPYGKAAEAVLRKHGLWDGIRPRLVLGDTITQAAQFATTGNAVGGLVAYSVVLGPGFAHRGTYAVIPESDHPPLRQRMVLLRRAGAAATQFYAYLQGAAARAILRKHGYGVPE